METSISFKVGFIGRFTCFFEQTFHVMIKGHISIKTDLFKRTNRRSSCHRHIRTLRYRRSSNRHRSHCPSRGCLTNRIRTPCRRHLMSH